MSKQILIGCGIFQKEITYLQQQHGWQLDTDFLNPALHINLEKLEKNLSLKIEKHSQRNAIIFYGACHPSMDCIVQKANAIRPAGQNCVEMLLGNELFTSELSNGAFFLLEHWALHWDSVIAKTFGNNMEITRQIFQEDRKYLLGVRTPCSGDFTKEAESAAHSVGLPLQWMDVDLHYLKSVLLSTIH